MKDETIFLIEIANQFGKDAQNALDFIAKSGNLEKAAKALSKPKVTDIRPTSAITGSNEDLPDGVYFIAENRTNYQLMTDDNTAPHFPTKYIGVKLGHRAIAVALKDLPGDNDGELRLLPRGHTSPKTSEHYSWDDEADKYRFNAFEDFDGKGNTERLKEYGSKIEVPEGEWIPSMGELGLLMMHATDVNRAIELAGGKPIKGWHWSSTEYSQLGAWYVGFSDGYTNVGNKYLSVAVRAVAAF